MNRETILKLGVVPVKRGPGFTTAENALISKNNAFGILKKLHKNIEVITIDDIIKDGIATSPDQVPEITDYLKAKKVDAIFIVHTDFGAEEIIAKVGKEMNLPLLLWGARDDAPTEDGIRIRDTQCGIFASSKVLMRYGVKFTYIENCHADDPVFFKGIEDFCRAASVLKAFRSMRILKIGDRPSSFLSVMCSEEELLYKFGIEVTPLAIGRLFSGVNQLKETGSRALDKQIESMKSRMDISALGEDKLRTLAAMIVFVKDEMDRCHCTGASIECWSSMGDLFGLVPCQAIGELTAMGYPVSCEGDICGAITSVLLHAADYNRAPSFFADLTIRHPENDNAELLWHCGPFPQALMGNTKDPSLDDGGRGQWGLKEGDITIARFDGINGNYSMFMGEAKAIGGPKTQGTYVWMEVDNWVEWEKKLVEGPYIHHVTGMYGKYSCILKEACKYIENLTPDHV